MGRHEGARVDRARHIWFAVVRELVARKSDRGLCSEGAPFLFALENTLQVASEKWLLLLVTRHRVCLHVRIESRTMRRGKVAAQHLAVVGAAGPFP